MSLNNLDKNSLSFSVLIPCLNEEKYIQAALSSIIQSANLTNESYEIIIIDGESTDNTLNLISDFVSRANIRILSNQRKIVSSALNIGIEHALGEYIFRCDAHCTYDETYFKKILDIHRVKKGMFCVGTLISTAQDHPNIIKKLMEQKYLVGNSFRTNKIDKKKKILSSETVPFGSWHKDTLAEIGLFNTDFVRSQDAEHNSRFKILGGKFLLLQEKLINYFSRDTFEKSLRMFSQYGYWKAQVMKKTRNIYLRPLAPLMLLISTVFTLYLSISNLYWVFFIFLYLVCLFYFNYHTFGNFKDSLKATIMCASIHYSYGLFFFFGIIVPLKFSSKIFPNLTRLTR